MNYIQQIKSLLSVNGRYLTNLTINTQEMYLFIYLHAVAVHLVWVQALVCQTCCIYVTLQSNLQKYQTRFDSTTATK